jgi:hypothetical protein
VAQRKIAKLMKCSRIFFRRAPQTGCDVQDQRKFHTGSIVRCLNAKAYAWSRLISRLQAGDPRPIKMLSRAEH